MARIRSIHPDVCRDDVLAEVSARAERTFLRLWVHLDDEGRAVDNAKLIKSDLYPLHDDMTATKVEADLAELAARGLLIRYEVEGKRYLSAKPDSWARYQRPRHPSESRFPPPPACVSVTADRGNPPADAADLPLGGGVGVGDGDGVVTPLHADPPGRRAPFWDDFETLWPCYPKRVGKADAFKAYSARRRDGVEHDRLHRAATNYAAARKGQDPTYTKHGQGFFAKDGLWVEWENGPPDEKPKREPGPPPCPTCDGRRQIEDPDPAARGMVVCPACRGTGRAA